MDATAIGCVVNQAGEYTTTDLCGDFTDG